MRCWTCPASSADAVDVAHADQSDKRNAFTAVVELDRPRFSGKPLPRRFACRDVPDLVNRELHFLKRRCREVSAQREANSVGLDDAHHVPVPVLGIREVGLAREEVFLEAPPTSA